jgi:hypothetical protein
MIELTYITLQATQSMEFSGIGDLMCVCFFLCKRQRDLGEELLSVAPDLHGSLAAYVLCGLYRLSANSELVVHDHK